MAISKPRIIQNYRPVLIMSLWEVFTILVALVDVIMKAGVSLVLIQFGAHGTGSVLFRSYLLSLLFPTPHSVDLLQIFDSLSLRLGGILVQPLLVPALNLPDCGLGFVLLKGGIPTVGRLLDIVPEPGFDQLFGLCGGIFDCGEGGMGLFGHSFGGG